MAELRESGSMYGEAARREKLGGRPCGRGQMPDKEVIYEEENIQNYAWYLGLAVSVSVRRISVQDLGRD